MHENLRGNCTPNRKWACFVVYLKIIHTLLENDMFISKQIVQGTQIWHWNFSRLSGFCLMDQNSQNIVFINTPEPLGQHKILMPFLSSLDNLFKMHVYHFSKKKKKKSFDNFEIEHKTCKFWSGVQCPLNTCQFTWLVFYSRLLTKWKHGTV